ncbi:hypothetical protein M9Y10_028213 [Tritrichomonas musculus]|uniref:Uncharacterized protein n=1 Tax=Tritrichomonas musculus TaxID=1915356 RepID=A0ABR2KIP2_9EUKA
MFRRSLYISHTVDYQVSPSELDFIEHLEDFNFMTLARDDQKLIDYFIDHFDFLLKYAFRLNAISDKRLYSKATSVFLADHPTIREQFHQKTHLNSFILRYTQNIEEYKSESHAAFFDLLPRLIMTDDQKKIYPEFLKKTFFQDILENINIQPAFEFLCNLPNIIPVSLHTPLFTVEIPQMIVQILKNDGEIDSDDSDYNDILDSENESESAQQNEGKSENDINKDDNSSIDNREKTQKKNSKKKSQNTPNDIDDFNNDEIERDFKTEQKIQRTQNLFIYYVKQRMITDIPATLMFDDSFEEIVKNSITERRPETFELIQFLMTIQNDLYPSNKWNDIYGIILAHFNDYCKVILHTKPFGLCSKYCINLTCAIIMSTKKLNDTFIEVFLALTESFFKYEIIKDEPKNQKKSILIDPNRSHFFKPNLGHDKGSDDNNENGSDNKVIERNRNYTNRNSFLHSCYLFIVKLLLNLNLLSEDLIEKSDLPNRIVDFFLAKSPKMFAAQTGQCMELFIVFDPIVSNLSLVDKEDWDKVKHIVEEKKVILSKPYGKPSGLNDSKTKTSSKPQGNFTIQPFIFIFILGMLVAFLIKFIN